MGRSVYLSFLFLSMSFVAVITATELDTAIRALGASFSAYDIHIDKAVPWKQLKNSIDALDHIKTEYNGQLVNDINNVIHHTNQLLDQYKKITNRLYSWAAEAYTTFSFLKDVVTEFPAEDVLDLSRDLIKRGVKLFIDTVNNMESISGNLTEIKNDLADISISLKQEMDEELNKFDDGIEKNKKINQQVDELMVILREVQEEAKLNWYDVLTAIITPVLNNVGTLNVPQILSQIFTGVKNEFTKCDPQSKISEVQRQIAELKHEFDGNATIENKIKKETFFKMLTESVNYAERNVTKFKEAVDEEIGKLNIEIKRIREYESVLLRVEVKTIKLDASIFKEISDLLEGYVKRHGGERIKNRRKRRSPRSNLVADFLQELDYVRNEVEATAKYRDIYFWSL